MAARPSRHVVLRHTDFQYSSASHSFHIAQESYGRICREMHQGYEPEVAPNPRRTDASANQSVAIVHPTIPGDVRKLSELQKRGLAEMHQIKQSRGWRRIALPIASGIRLRATS